MSCTHRLYLREGALVKLLGHVTSGDPAEKELMGFLFGTVAQWEGSRYTIVESSVTTDLEVSHPREWKKEGLDPDEIFSQVHRMDDQGSLVGWYHSSAEDDFRFSRVDVKLHMRMFPKGGGVGVIVNPDNIDMRAFVVRKSGMPREVSYGVI